MSGQKRVTFGIKHYQICWTYSVNNLESNSVTRKLIKFHPILGKVAKKAKIFTSNLNLKAQNIYIKLKV
jgi:hypothetical protein